MNIQTEYVKKKLFADHPICPFSEKEFKHIFTHRKTNGWSSCFIHPTPRATLVHIPTFMKILKGKVCEPIIERKD